MKIEGNYFINPHVQADGVGPNAIRSMSYFADSIEKACQQGWNGQLREDEWHVHLSPLPGRVVLCYPKPSINQVLHMDSHQVIFSHDFAQTIWGDDFKLHLQAMVIATDPLQYLGAHINDKVKKHL